MLIDIKWLLNNGWKEGYDPRGGIFWHQGGTNIHYDYIINEWCCDGGIVPKKWFIEQEKMYYHNGVSFKSYEEIITYIEMIHDK